MGRRSSSSSSPSSLVVFHCASERIWPLETVCTGAGICDDHTGICTCTFDGFLQFGDLSNIGGCFIYDKVVQSLWGIAGVLLILTTIMNFRQLVLNFGYDLRHCKLRKILSYRQMSYSPIFSVLIGIVGTITSFIRVRNPEYRYGVDKTYTWLHSITLTIFWFGAYFYIDAYFKIANRGQTMIRMRRERMRNHHPTSNNSSSSSGSDFTFEKKVFIIHVASAIFTTIGCFTPVIAVYVPSKLEQLATAHLMMMATTLFLTTWVSFPVCAKLLLNDIDILEKTVLSSIAGSSIKEAVNDHNNNDDDDDDHHHQVEVKGIAKNDIGQISSSSSSSFPELAVAQIKLQELRLQLKKTRRVLFLHGTFNWFLGFLTASIPLFRTAVVPYYLPLSFMSAAIGPLVLLSTMTTGNKQHNLSSRPPQQQQEQQLIQAVSSFSEIKFHPNTQDRLTTVLEVNSKFEQS